MQKGCAPEWGNGCYTEEWDLSFLEVWPFSTALYNLFLLFLPLLLLPFKNKQTNYSLKLLLSKQLSRSV